MTKNAWKTKEPGFIFILKAEDLTLRRDNISKLIDSRVNDSKDDEVLKTRRMLNAPIRL
jgi:hypothetical protein